MAATEPASLRDLVWGIAGDLIPSLPVRAIESSEV
jgi:hypothetical protein